MEEYSLVIRDAQNAVDTREHFYAQNDLAAVDHASGLLQFRSGELWLRDRIVRRFEGGETPNAGPVAE